ncbi:MAG: FAD binding domain-containing protein [Pseudomonadota bacterium]
MSAGAQRWYRPRELAEALAIKASRGADVQPIAGGTDLMVAWRLSTAPMPALLDLGAIGELRGICEDPDRVVIGATTPCSTLAADARIQRGWPMLAQSAALTGSVAIQNRATLGGNVMNASPAADNPPVLLAYGARLHLASASGRRVVDYSGFHTGYRQTIARPDELVVAIELPRPAEATTVWYRKVGTRRAQAISKVALAACLQWQGSRVIRARFGFASLGPVPALAGALAHRVEGCDPGRLDAGALAQAIDEDFRPIDDVRSTGAYRRQVAINLVRGALGLA